MSHEEKIARELGVRASQVAAAVRLLDEGNTVPFIARYRKEMTGTLDDEQVRRVADLIKSLRALDERRSSIVSSVREQGRLSPELEASIAAADTLSALEDLYAPYRPKRRTRAMIAREKGLEPLADMILAQKTEAEKPTQAAKAFLNDQVTSVEEALSGAKDIVAEMIADDADIRSRLRAKALSFATLISERNPKTDDPKATYASYYDFSARVSRLQSYQVLALNRGESESVLKVRVEVDERDWRELVFSLYRGNPRSAFAALLAEACEDSALRLVLPAIERDVRRELSEKADTHAIGVFATNLRGLLGIAPLTGRTVLGLDPGFRTGCKIAVVDPTGKVLDTTTIYPHEPQKDRAGALATLEGLISRHGVSLISIGNGTASRESEELAAELVSQREGLRYLIVNEAGASIYSASPLARAELPNLDVSIRGAVSIARRAQDPLAELVKIDPQSIGVGLYQHDVDQAELAHSLAGVVESMVNAVGVDLNTASPALLSYVAGLGPKLASGIVAHRDAAGPFPTREALKKVAGLGPKTFEQAAGFLRIRGGKNPLDESAIHPESYPSALALLSRAGLAPASAIPERTTALDSLGAELGLPKLASEIGCGEPTLRDIIEQLKRPGRDPREEAPAPVLRSSVVSMDDLSPGLVVKGTVRNVVDFGAFVDIGVKQDGLLHRSRIPSGRHLGVGDVIDVEITGIEKERGRISLGWAPDTRA